MKFDRGHLIQSLQFKSFLNLPSTTYRIYIKLIYLNQPFYIAHKSTFYHSLLQISSYSTFNLLTYPGSTNKATDISARTCKVTLKARCKTCGFDCIMEQTLLCVRTVNRAQSGFETRFESFYHAMASPVVSLLLPSILFLPIHLFIEKFLSHQHAISGICKI